ncbi:MAG: transcriptional regulator [Pedobacter sp.]|jgi:DNA-binding LacI/PurR family transcriptional regulator|nr:transcriptional regulator [Pedobacter sp.]
MSINRLPTIKEIARKLNISTSTVSRALHDHPSIGWVTTMRVKQLAEELNYEPNFSAISFKQRKTFTIGVLLPNLSEAFFSTAISGIEEFASTKKYNVLIGQSLDDPEREVRILESMKNHRVDGMIVSVSKNTTSFEHFEQLQHYNIPIVFFDCIPERTDVHYSACNLQTGMLKAIETLVAKGITNIALINGPAHLNASKQRQQIYFKGLKMHNIPYDPQMMQTTDLSKEGNLAAMDKLFSLEHPPKAIITFNDYLALDAIVAAKARNMVINKDIYFISFANLPIWSYMNERPLASIEQFPHLQAEKATEILFSLMEAEPGIEVKKPCYQQVIFDSELILHSL